MMYAGPAGDAPPGSELVVTGGPTSSISQDLFVLDVARSLKQQRFRYQTLDFS